MIIVIDFTLVSKKEMKLLPNKSLIFAATTHNTMRYIKREIIIIIKESLKLLRSLSKSHFVPHHKLNFQIVFSFRGVHIYTHMQLRKLASPRQQPSNQKALSCAPAHFYTHLLDHCHYNHTKPKLHITKEERALFQSKKEKADQFDLHTCHHLRPQSSEAAGKGHVLSDYRGFWSNKSYAIVSTTILSILDLTKKNKKLKN